MSKEELYKELLELAVTHEDVLKGTVLQDQIAYTIVIYDMMSVEDITEYLFKVKSLV